MMKKGTIPGIALGAVAAVGISVMFLLASSDKEHKHSYTSSVAQEADCTHNGVIVYTCTECGEQAEELTEPIDHNYTEAETVEPTFDHGGYTLFRCTACGKEYKDNETPALEKILANANVSLKTDAFVYTGKEIRIDTSKDKEAVKVYFKEDEVLTEGKDYELSYENNVDVGTAKLIVSGKDGWQGTKEAGFMIYPAGCEITAIDTGSGIHVEWSEVKGADGYELYFGKDKEFKTDTEQKLFESGSVTSADLADNPEKGKIYYAKVRAFKIHGEEKLGSFGSTKEIVIKDAIGELTLSQTSFAYAGKAITPEAVLKDKQGKVLKKDTDYTIAYANNTEPGTATVTVTGIGVYSGIKTANFTIRPADIKDINFVGLSDVYLYSGKPVEPDPTLVLGSLKLEKGKDYDVSYSGNTSVGSGGSMTFTFKGRFSGSVTKSFRIENTGWETVGGLTYFVENGSRYTKEGMRAIDGATYYFGSDGSLQTGWIKIGDGYYCFDRLNGKMYAATNVDGITVGADGRAVATDYAVFRITTMMTAHRVVLEQTKPTDTMEEKRLKLFNWILAFPYKQWRTLNNIYDISTDWEMTFANDIFRKGSGCCVSDSSALAFLFREIGLTDIYICHDSGHCWVMVGDRLFDPVFAEAKNFQSNYNAIPSDYRQWPLRKRRVDGKAYDGAPS